MFAGVRNFLYRHRKKFVVGGFIIGGAFFLSRYAQRKIRQWQERETREFLERTRQQQHFESTERTCNLTVLSLAPKVKDALLRQLDSDLLTIQLKSRPPNRIELWEDLKIVAFTRAAALVYAGTMLVVMLRIQLNLVGGYMYWDSAQKLVEGESSQARSQVTSSLQQNYLLLCHYFVETGVKDLCIMLEKKVKSIIQGISLKQKLNLQDIEQIFWAIQTSVSNDASDPVKHLPLYMLSAKPGQNGKGIDVDLLNKMVTETVDLLESEEVVSLASSCVSQGFGHLVDRIANYFTSVENGLSLHGRELVPEKVKQLFPVADNETNGDANPKPEDGIDTLLSNNSQEELWVNSVNKESPDYCISNVAFCDSNIGNSFIHPNRLCIAMAKLIPIVNGLLHQAKGEAPDPWMQQLILMDKLKVLGANVYETFSHKV